MGNPILDGKQGTPFLAWGTSELDGSKGSRCGEAPEQAGSSRVVGPVGLVGAQCLKAQAWEWLRASI